MTTWDPYIYDATLVASEHLVNISTEMRNRLADQGGKLSLDDAQSTIRQIIGIVESMFATVEVGKSGALLDRD